jgi:hypothetical protein
MKKNNLLSILITFVVGLFAGGYLFTTGFAETVSRYTTPDAESITAFSVVGYIYGSCGDSCPSFQVVQDGAYRYFYAPKIGAEQVLIQGIIPFSVQRQLKQSFIIANLEKQSQVRRPVQCNSSTDGIDARYEVTIDGKKYVLDSCGTDIDGSGKIWQALNGLWGYYETEK